MRSTILGYPHSNVRGGATPAQISPPLACRVLKWDFRWNARYIRDSMELFGPFAQLTIDPAKTESLAGGPNSSPKRGSERRKPPRRVSNSSDTAVFSSLSGPTIAPVIFICPSIRKGSACLAYTNSTLHSHWQSPASSLFVAALRHSVFNYQYCALPPISNRNTPSSASRQGCKREPCVMLLEHKT